MTTVITTKSNSRTSIRVTDGLQGAGVPPGGTSGQALVKTADGDFAVGWGTATASAAWGAISGTLSAQTDLQAELDAKQDTLVSATNIKTINGSSVLGAGDLTVSAGVADGDKGDITVSALGATWTIDNAAVTLAKMANMATASLIYRKTAGSGAPEVNTLATLKTDLGLTGTNSGDQTITLTGMVTGSGTGSFAASLGSFTKAQLDAAVSDGNVLYVGDVTSNATHTGDATGATALTLATVNANVGAFGSATQVATFTVNAKGLTTAAGATAIAIPASQITDFNSASRAQTEAELIAGANVTITPAGSGATRTLTIAASGGGAGTDLTYTAATRVIASSTGTDATLPLVTTGDAGLAPASGGGTTNFLRADGTWAAPSGGGGFDYGINAAMSGLCPY